MPCDYKKYHPDWLTVIRPAILERAGNKCEQCNVLNGKIILRGNWHGVDCYQDDDGTIFDASNSEVIGGDYLGEVHPTNKMIKIVLTVSHTDHDIKNNDYSNLKALCQRCHIQHDKNIRAENSKATRNKKKKQLKLDL